MKTYIGVEIVQAKPVFKIKGVTYSVDGPVPRSMDRQEGYEVIYPDGYVSYSPKHVFEKAYTEITGEDNKVSQEDVDSFIDTVKDSVMGEKTSFVQVTLKNGFVLCETSSCVDSKNFDHEIGKEICMNRIKNNIWYLLGFLLQSGVSGFKKKGELV